METKFFLSIMISMLFAVITGPLLASVTGFNPVAMSGALFAASWIPKPSGIMAMALDVEIWKPWILEQLFAGNDFLNYAKNADEHILQGKVVHIPNAGSASSVVKNRTSLPATITKRTDVDVTYALDEFTSNPRLLTDAEKILSYNKMASAMGQDMNAIKDLVARWMMYNWVVYSTGNGDTADIQKVQTTGASAATYLTGTTGNRLKFHPDNIAEAQAVLDGQDVPAENGYLLIGYGALQQLTSYLSVGDYKDFSRVFDPVKGVMGELFGFKFIKRSSVLTCTNGDVMKYPGQTVAVTDQDVAIAWQADFVERAIGEVKIFEKLNDPTYYGDIYSLLVRAGGRHVDNAGKGIVAIIGNT